MNLQFQNKMEQNNNNNKYNQSYGFSSSHVRMWELDHKEGWAPKNWCFQIVVLEKIFFNLFLIEGYLLYSTVLVSTKHQHESAIGLPMSLPTWTSPTSLPILPL